MEKKHELPNQRYLLPLLLLHDVPGAGYEAMGRHLLHATEVLSYLLPAEEVSCGTGSHPKSSFKVPVTLTNAGTVTWGVLNDMKDARDKLLFSYQRLTSEYRVISSFDGPYLLPYKLRPGELYTCKLTLQAPSSRKYYLELDMVQPYVAMFHEKGSPTGLIEIDVQ